MAESEQELGSTFCPIEALAVIEVHDVRLIALLALTSFGPVMGAELEVTKVILSKHGVGYFERSGEIGQGDAAALELKASKWTTC